MTGTRQQEVSPAGTSMRYEDEILSRSMAVWKKRSVYKRSNATRF